MGVGLCQVVPRMVDLPDQVERQGFVAHLDAARQPHRRAAHLIVEHEQGVVFEQGAVQRPAAGDEVDAGQNRGQQRLHALETGLHVRKFALRRAADRADGQAAVPRELRRGSCDEAGLGRTQRDGAVAHVGDGGHGAVQHRRPGPVDLRQHHVRQDARVFLREQAGERHGRGGARDGLRRHGKRLAVLGADEQPLRLLLGHLERADD